MNKILERIFTTSSFAVKSVWKTISRSPESDHCIEDRTLKDSLSLYSPAILEFPNSFCHLPLALDQAILWLSLNERGIIQDANQKFCQFSQYSREELMGQKLQRLPLVQEGKKFFKDRLISLFQENTWSGEIQMSAKDGNLFWVHTRIVPIVDECRKLRQYIAIAFDITEQKQAEFFKQQQEEQLKLVLQVAGVGIWDWNTQTHALKCDENTQRLLGLKPGTFSGTWQAFIDSIYSEDRDSVLQAARFAVEDKRGFEQEFRTINSQGSLNWLTLKTHLFCNETGEISRVLGTVTDITALKLSQIALQQQTEREHLVGIIAQRLRAGLEQQVKERTAQLQQALNFEAMLKRITDKVRDSLDESQILQTAVQELGAGLGVRSCNASLYDFNNDTSTICYEYNNSMFSDKGRIASMADHPEIYQLLLQGQYLQFCNTIINPVRGRVSMLACPIFDDQGVLGDLWLINDKDYAFRELELRMVQQVATQCAIALRQARLYEASQSQVKALQKLNWLKDDFLSTVSHELRTPVANMKMAIKMLEICTGTDSLSPEKRQKINQYLHILSRECEREINLIDDLLDLQRLEAGRQSLVLETVPLKHWLDELIEPFQDRASARQQTLILELPPEEVPPLVSDISSLSRLVSELLNNACKYTPPGEKIILRVHTQPGKIQLHITNSGVEIPAAELPRIFDKFYRVESADPWKQGGTGLGLALVRRIAEHLGGEIRVESANLQTSFTLELPNHGVLSRV